MMKTILILTTAILAFLTAHPHAAETEPKIPYIAYNMLLQTQVRINNKSNDYLEFLENSFGVNKKQIEQVYKFLSVHKNEENVRLKVMEEISKSLKEYKNTGNEKDDSLIVNVFPPYLNLMINQIQIDENVKRRKNDFFIVNILAPYLTLMAKRTQIDGEDNREIQKIFAKVFSNENESRNFLGELENGTVAYNSGGHFNVDYTLNMNSLLQAKGFHLDYRLWDEYSNIYKIFKTVNIQWKKHKKFDILLLKRMYPNAVPAQMGHSYAFADNVAIIEDFYPLIAKAYRDDMSKKGTVNLIYKDFVGSSLEQIKTALIIQIAIHEAKHKVDEYEMPKMRLNIDREISAYLTAAIFSPCPFNGLISAINQVEGFSRNFSSRKLDKMLEQLNILEAASIKDNYTSEQLKAELRKIYSNYLTIDGNKRFINLIDFENIVVAEIYRVYR